MRKLLPVFVLLMTLLFPSGKAYAFIPLIGIPAKYFVASLAVHVATLAGLYVAMTPDGRTTVASNGELSRSVDVTYVDISGPMPIIVDDTATMKMPIDKVRELANKEDNPYPITKSKLIDESAQLIDNLGRYADGEMNLYGRGLPSGNWSVNITNEVLGCSFKTQAGVAASSLGANGGWIQIRRCVGGACNGSTTCQSANTTYTITKPSDPNPVKPSPVATGEFVRRSTGSESGGLVPAEESLYQAELDKMFQDPDYIPVFTDDTTGLPKTYPDQNTIMTPAALEAYNNNAQIHNDAEAARQATSAAHQENLTTTQAAATSSRARANAASSTSAAAASAAANAESESAADPTNQAKKDEAERLREIADAAKRAADAAESAAEAAEAAAAAAKVEAAKDDEEAKLLVPGLPGNNTYDLSVDTPDKKSLASLLSSWFNSSPIKSMLQSFTMQTENTESSVYVGEVYGKEISFDFARYQNTFALMGGVLLAVVHGIAVYIVVRGW